MKFACDKDKMESDKESGKETEYKRKRTKKANEKIVTQVTIMTSSTNKT